MSDDGTADKTQSIVQSSPGSDSAQTKPDSERVADAEKLESPAKNIDAINIENNENKVTVTKTSSDNEAASSSTSTVSKPVLRLGTSKLTVAGGGAPVAPTGAAAILKNIAKKSKLSTFEKSRLDWNSFKKENEIEDELDAYKKGKSGYLDRQDFLQRADLRQFEIEKELRSRKRKMI